MGKGELHLDRVQARTSNKMAGKSQEDLRLVFHRLKTLDALTDIGSHRAASVPWETFLQTWNGA